MTAIALATGSWVLVGVRLLGAGRTPGAQGRSELSGRDEGEGSAFDTHGIR